MKEFFKKLSFWTVTTAMIWVALFGVGLGGLNTEIDFCADSTSGRYIFADSVRREVCPGGR